MNRKDAKQRSARKNGENRNANVRRRMRFMRKTLHSTFPTRNDVPCIAAIALLNKDNLSLIAFS
jgi:hypothetical protein